MIEDSQPLQGSVVTATNQQMLSVTITDPNVEDDLYVRWIAEYPPYSSSSKPLTADVKVSHSANGLRLHKMQPIVINCLSSIARVPQHPITVLVSDRPFWDASDANAPTDLETLLIGLPDAKIAKKTEANWVVNLSCPQ